MERADILREWRKLWEEEDRIREEMIRPLALKRKELEKQDAEWQALASNPFYIRYDEWCERQTREERYCK